MGIGPHLSVLVESGVQFPGMIWSFEYFVEPLYIPLSFSTFTPPLSRSCSSGVPSAFPIFCS